MTTLLDAARQALEALEWCSNLTQTAIDHKSLHTAIATLRTAIAEAEKTHCRYPECVENEREECQRWISGECPGPGKSNV